MSINDGHYRPTYSDIHVGVSLVLTGLSQVDALDRTGG
jgi:hypothetical protein